MNYKKFAIGGIIAGIAYAIIGWLVYTQILANYLAHHTGHLGLLGRVKMNYKYLLLGNLLQGFLLAYIFEVGNIKTLVKGLITAAIIGFLLSSAYDFVMYGTTFILSKKGLMADVLGFTCMSAIVGAMLGYVNDKLR
jgi:hypothetical protein